MHTRLKLPELFVSLYNWYPMPPTVHKVLMHGSQFIRRAIVPIGQLSEEAQEARDKGYRRFREHHTKNRSRTETTTDLIHLLLVSSDPKITSLRQVRTTKPTEMHPDALALLEVSEEASCEEEGDNDDIDDSSSESEE